MDRIVVIGAGQAGSSLTAKLRNLGFENEIVLIGDEPVPPYQRPPLSKGYLLGEMTEERLYLRPAEFYEEQGIELRTTARVAQIDPETRTVHLDNEALTYDALALTTGSVPLHLPAKIGGNLKNVYSVRSLADVDQMRSEFTKGRRVLIVGGGYIGLEAAAVAAKLGLEVTLAEMADRILQRVAAPETSDYVRALHQSQGVNILEGTGLSRLIGDGKVEKAELSNGDVLGVDFVIVGIGIMPGDALAADAGLEIENGIKTDAHGRTSDPNIWAAGDCASFPYRGERIRLESVQNAIDQAELVAANILGAETEYDPTPWFWSDQFDLKLQIAGLNTGYDRIAVRKSEEAMSHWYYRGETLLAVDAMNDPRAFMVSKRLIDAGKSPDFDAIKDAATDLKALLRG